MNVAYLKVTCGLRFLLFFLFFSTPDCWCLFFSCFYWATGMVPSVAKWKMVLLWQGFPNTFLEPPQHCTFCMSPLSITPDSTHQLISSNSKTWNGCVRQRRHAKCAVLGRLQERVWKTLFYGITVKNTLFGTFILRSVRKRFFGKLKWFFCHCHEHPVLEPVFLRVRAETKVHHVYLSLFL